MKEEFFPYRKLSHHTFGKIKIPSVELTLKATREVKLYAIVDSGAVISLFPRSVCDLLGLKYEAGMKASLLESLRVLP
jgi:hypothetical protein